MKSSLPYLFSLAVFIASCNSTEKKTAATDTAQTTGVTRRVVVQQHLPKNFYKRFQGIVGDQNVTINLSRIGNTFTGTLDYNDKQVNLTTDTIITQDSIILKESGLANHYEDDYTPEAKLHLKWTGTAFSGLRVGDKQKSSIHLEEKYPDGSYTFNIAGYSDSLKAFPKKKNSPLAVIEYEYLMPSGHTPPEQWLDEQIKKILEVPKKSSSWAAGIKTDADNYLSAYKTEIKGLGTEVSGPDYTLNYYRTQNLYLQYNDNGYAIIKYFINSYSGGAHNNYATSMHCFDVKNQKRLLLSDVIAIDSISLQKLVEKNFRIQYKVKSEEALTTQLFEDHLAANDNFFFNAAGISFLYNPYEVASYAQGQIVVQISYKDLKKYLNPVFAKRIAN
ncbi:DUF3298 domain-containing protein [Pedobacter sp. PAMC26386]|nr:DUF3298 domain-containing protein [Pedobacter sp. PAMC26386]